MQTVFGRNNDTSFVEAGAKNALNEFATNLQSISAAIRARNKGAKENSYQKLDPNRIPNGKEI